MKPLLAILLCALCVSSIAQPLPPPLSPQVIAKIKARQAAAAAKKQMVSLVGLPSKAVRAEATAKVAPLVVIAKPRTWFVESPGCIFEPNTVLLIDSTPDLSKPMWTPKFSGVTNKFAFQATLPAEFFRATKSNTVTHEIARCANYAGYIKVVMGR